MPNTPHAHTPPHPLPTYTPTHTHTHTHTPVTRQAQVPVSLKVQSFTDDQADTVLEQEDGVCERSQP